MPRSTRREFLRHTTAISLSLAATGPSTISMAASPNDSLSVGIIGCGGRGRGLMEDFRKVARITHVCDPDEGRCETAKQQLGAPHAFQDLRRVLDDPSVDAVVIATPDHWHAPAAILACEAGKHVYVEKPCSHNLREAQLLLAAARRNRVIVQHGTQHRSNPLIRAAIQMLSDGMIGDVLVAKAWNIQKRRSIGHGTPSDPPEGIDYDSWVGPAEFMPYQKNRFHYDWHWWHNFGTGDLGNDGTHEIDYARWGLGVTGLPTSVVALGGKYFFDDDQQFPDTATCVFEWPGDGSVGQRRQLIFEMRIWSTNYPYNCDSGAEFYGTKGRLFVSKRGKLEVYDERNRRMEDASPSNADPLEGSHIEDFVSGCRTGQPPRAEIAIAYDTVALVHLGNIACRVGRALQVDKAGDQIVDVVDDDEATQLLSRRYRAGGHWAIPQGL